MKYDLTTALPSLIHKEKILQSDKFIRIKEVCDKAGIKPSTVWLWTKQGKLPQPVKLSNRVTVWRLSEIEAYVSNGGAI